MVLTVAHHSEPRPRQSLLCPACGCSGLIGDVDRDVCLLCGREFYSAHIQVFAAAQLLGPRPAPCQIAPPKAPAIDVDEVPRVPAPRGSAGSIVERTRARADGTVRRFYQVQLRHGGERLTRYAPTMAEAQEQLAALELEARAG